MDIFSMNCHVLSGDVGPNLELKVSTLFGWMQEATMAHAIEMGISREQMYDRGLLWVVIQYRLRIRRLPSYPENVTLTSWLGKDMRVFFGRYYSLTGADGEPLADASAYWAVMSKETRELVFPSESGICVEGNTTGKEIPLPTRIRTFVPDSTSSFTVPYSFLDLNGHMNNTRYFDLALDHMSDDMRALPIKELSADFISEARYGDQLTLGTHAEKDRFLISGMRDKDVFRLDYRFRT